MSRKPKNNLTQQPNGLLQDLKTLIEKGRDQAIAAVNSAITVTYWHVG